MKVRHLVLVNLCEPEVEHVDLASFFSNSDRDIVWFDIAVEVVNVVYGFDPN
jgi:hypothetical protein